MRLPFLFSFRLHSFHPPFHGRKGRIWDISKIPTDTNRVLRLYINLNKDFKLNPLYPDLFRTKALENKLTLEDLFSIRPDTKLLIYIGCYDAFSGSRKVFLSDAYSADLIKEGRFKNMEVVHDAKDDGNNSEYTEDVP